MKFSGKDLAALSRPLLVLGVVLVLGVMAVVYSSGMVKRAHAQVSTQQSAMTEAEQRVKSSGDERDAILRHIGPYRELERQGMIGEEQRINWLDALRAANTEAGLYGIDYQIEAQQAYAHAVLVNAGSLPVQQSIMKLNFGLLYEQDLLRFFRALAAQNVGRFVLNQCDVQRLVAESAAPVDQPTLRAECELAWITIAQPDATANRP